MSKTMNLFISHVHEDDKEVRDLKQLLTDQGYTIRDGSIDSTKPNDAKNPNYIKSEILAPRIKWAGTMIVLVSPDTHKSDWVDWEIEYANKNDTRIVGVWYRGAKESDLPENLENYGDSMVGWNGKAIIDAIEGTNSWTKSDGQSRDKRDIPRIDCQ